MSLKTTTKWSFTVGKLVTMLYTCWLKKVQLLPIENLLKKSLETWCRYLPGKRNCFQYG